MMSDFVFCTGRYESGDWDSAPSLPANLIDSIARYTGIAVAPSGAIVPLGSEAILEYPLVYMTGHLPFRFSEAERRNARKLVERGGMIFHRRPQPRHRRRVPQDGNRGDYALVLTAQRTCRTIIRSIVPFSSSMTARRRRVTS
jgi:hypothetical protein